MDRCPKILQQDKNAINKMKKVENKDLEIMKAVDKELIDKMKNWKMSRLI